MNKTSKSKTWIVILSLFLGLSAILYFFGSSPSYSGFSFNQLKVNKHYVLVHEFKGAIMDSRKWIEKVEKYVEKSSIKAVVFIVNSPGGIVGPSQELYHYIKEIREKTKKPVIVYSGTVLASGAYYMALGADKVFVSPGAMVGSIGVIMEFVNLEGLYDWAKVRRFSINSGKFKDSGAEYRPMRDDEKELFQNLINDVYDQFTSALMSERQLGKEIVEQYADGRILTGRQAKEAGLVDQVGYLKDAIAMAGEMAGYSAVEPYYIPKESLGIIDILTRSEESEMSIGGIQKALTALRAQLIGQPLYILPTFTGAEL